MRDHLRRSPFVWVVLLLCALYVVLSVFTAIISIRYYGMMKAPGWEARATDAGWVVTSIVPDGAAAGRLEPGDRLLALNGDERAAVLGPPLFDNVPVDQTYRVDLARDGRQFSAELMLPLVQGRLLWPIFQIIGLVFFVCGAALALLRPDDPQVRLVGGVLMAVGFTTLLEAEGGARRFPLGPAERSIQTLIAALSLFTFPMAFHFFNRFPSWKSPGPLWRATQWLLYALLACVFLPAWVMNFLGYDVTPETSRFVLAHPSLYLTCVQISARGVFVYIGGCLLLAMIAVGWNYRRLADVGSRRRIRLVVAGLIAACTPFVVVVVVAYRVFALIDEMTYRFWYPVTFVSMLCIPASIATAVWNEQLFDIRVFVRRGLQYLLARTALRTLLALPIALLLFSIFRNPDRTVGQMLTQGSGWLNFVLIGAIGAALQTR
jgi:hypothetical protein